MRRKEKKLYKKIEEQALGIGIGIVDNEEIDKINILNATKKAMKMAINNCNIRPEHVLIDAVKLDIDIPTTSIIKGDLKKYNNISS